MTSKKKIDNPEIRRGWDATEAFYNDISERLKPGIHINDGQPGTGKTNSLAKTIARTDKTIAFFTSNHNHLDKFKEDLDEYGISDKEYIHGKGFERSCLRYPKSNNPGSWTGDEAFLHKIHKGFGVKSSRFLCSACSRKRGCEYYEYTHNAKRYRITLQPLEFLYTGYNSDKGIFIIDEVVSKKEKILWNFDPTKLNKFMDKIEETSGEKYGLRDYVDDILEFHRAILQHTSLIFKESPATFFDMDNNTFKTKEFTERMFLQHGNIVTHPENISLCDHLDRDVMHYLLRLSVQEGYGGIIRYTDEQIRNAIRDRSEGLVDELIKNHVPLRTWLRFFKLLLLKKLGEEICLLVSERIEKIPMSDLRYRDKKIIRTDGNYEWGFVDECPYVMDKTKGRCIVARIGKAYEDVGKNPEELKDTWVTMGHPFMFQVFNIAEQKPVIILDATFNSTIFEKLYSQWLIYRVCEETAKHPEEPITKAPRIRKRIYRIKRPTITNKKSIVYDVGGHFPLETLEENLPKVEGCIAKILDDNPGKSHAIISHERFEEELGEMFKEAHTAHHFDERGKNMNVDLLFVIGTPFRPPYTVIYDYILTFNEYPESIGKKEERRFTGYKDTLLHEVLQINVYDENYHEIHRSRILLYNREVYAFCEISGNISEEVTVKKIEDMDSISGSPLWYLIDLIAGNKGITLKGFYEKTKNRKKYEVAGGGKILLEQLEDMGYVTLKKEKAKTRDKTRIYITKAGKRFHRTFKKLYGK